MQNLIPRIYNYFASIPEGIDIHHWRFYMVSNFANTTGAVTHLIWVGVFFWLGIYPLAWANLLSSALLFLNLWLNRRHHLLLAGVLAVTVLIGQYSMATYYLGMDAGFQYYILLVSLFPLIMPSRHAITKYLLFVACLGSFVLLDLWLSGLTPRLDPVDGMIGWLRLFNIAFSFIILGAWGMYFNYAMNRTEHRLETMYDEAERLIHNILPRRIARRLRHDPHAIADKYPSVSVLFADLVGFTELSMRTAPVELVDLLNTIFSRFDDLVDKHGMEKIKTIGDAYMAVSGLPEAAEDHAERAAAMALDILEEVDHFNREQGTSLAIRIGIDSGSVVAGVIGKKKFSYDLWGDTVNTASRMETYSLPGRIHVSDATYALLRHKYHFQSRGTMVIKGKGEMETWFLMSGE